jgi:molecular chaperone DnaK (HSP70)
VDSVLYWHSPNVWSLLVQVLAAFRKSHPNASEPSVSKATELQKLCKLAKEAFQDDTSSDVQSITVNAYSGDITLDEVISREAYDLALKGLVERCMNTVEEAIKVTELATKPGSDTRQDCPQFSRSKVDKVRVRGALETKTLNHS